MPTPTRTPTLQLATAGDAPAIARLSRDRIEHGLEWSWTAPRVLRSIQDAETNVLVAVAASRVIGFGVMKYREEDAHLLLLAVQADSAGLGIGRSLVAWLEEAACTAGLGRVLLESRASNAGARTFYRRLGYAEGEELPGYYQGRETAVRMTKALRIERAAPA